MKNEMIHSRIWQKIEKHLNNKYMLCEKYRNLTPIQQIVMIGQIVHALQNDNSMFEHVKSVIELASLKDVYQGVTILPNNTLEEKK